MSFPLKNKNFFLAYKRLQMQRKENDSSLTHHFFVNSSPIKERTSAFTSNGSITVEAAFAVSLFFFAAICLVTMLEIMSIQTSVNNALHAVGKEYMAEAYLRPFMSPGEIEKKVVDHIGKERLDKSYIVDGCAGLDLSDSKKYWDTTIMDLTAKYQIEIPIAVFRIPMLWQTETVRVKGWTGREWQFHELEHQKLVYVTDYGVVYHADRYCTYLDLSIRALNKADVEEYRSQNGSKYKACMLCAFSMNQDQVYITDYGERYHGSLECSGLKRSVYAVPLADVYGLGGCSKCVD